MPILTHVVGSPRGEISVSSALAERFIDGYVAGHDQVEVRTLRVFDDHIPSFGALEAMAKLAPLEQREKTAAEEEAWQLIVDFIVDFDRANVVVLSSPIWNFHVPWRLKLFFDVLLQPFVSFGFDEAGSTIGLLRDRPVRMFLSRSSTSVASADDFQLPWLRRVWEMVGMVDVDAVAISGADAHGGDLSSLNEAAFYRGRTEVR